MHLGGRNRSCRLLRAVSIYWGDGTSDTTGDGNAFIVDAASMMVGGPEVFSVVRVSVAEDGIYTIKNNVDGHEQALSVTVYLAALAGRSVAQFVVSNT